MDKHFSPIIRSQTSSHLIICLCHIITLFYIDLPQFIEMKKERIKGKQRVSATLQRLSESATIAMARMARELRDKGHNVISLSLGEPDFNTPDFIKEAAKRAIDNNYSHYTPVNGYVEVRESISKKFKRDNNLDYNPDQIVLSTGAKQSIANAVMALCGPGDEVLLPAPFWVSYSDIIKLSGAKPVTIKTSIDTDFKIDADQLRTAINENTRMMIFSSPCNPSGSVYGHDELESLANVVKDYPEFYVICDEIYEHINFTNAHSSLASFEDVYEQVITINGVSKAFAMTGWRLGYMGAPTWIANACNKMQGQITSAPSGISQMAAKEAVEADPKVVNDMKEAFLHRREMVYNLLKDIPGIRINKPEGAFYFLPNISAYFGKTDGTTTISNASDLCMFLLENEFVALVTGEAFGNENCIRISYAAAEEELKEACARIKNGLSKLH